MQNVKLLNLNEYKRFLRKNKIYYKPHDKYSIFIKPFFYLRFINDDGYVDVRTPHFTSVSINIEYTNSLHFHHRLQKQISNLYNLKPYYSNGCSHQWQKETYSYASGTQKLQQFKAAN